MPRANQVNAVITRFDDGLYGLKRIVDGLLAAQSLTIMEMRNQINGLNGAFQQGADAYQVVRSKTGSAAAAQAFLTARLFDQPADIGAALTAVAQAYNAFASAYAAMIPAQGVRAFTYDATTKTHADISALSARDALRPQLEALQAALTPLTS